MEICKEKVGDILYTNLGESQFRKFKEHKELLSPDEKSILQEIAFIKEGKTLLGVFSYNPDIRKPKNAKIIINNPAKNPKSPI